MVGVVREQVSVPRRTRRRWLHIFLVGLALWVAAVVVIFLTGNPNLIPTLVLLGSFLVPVTFVAWAFERRDTGELTAGLVFSTFLTGGVLGVLGASVLEAYLLRPSPWLFIEPSTEQVNLFSVMQWAGLAIISIIGIAWLVVLWRRSARLRRVAAPSPVPPSPHGAGR